MPVKLQRDPLKVSENFNLVIISLRLTISREKGSHSLSSVLCVAEFFKRGRSIANRNMKISVGLILLACVVGTLGAGGPNTGTMTLGDTFCKWTALGGLAHQDIGFVVVCGK